MNIKIHRDAAGEPLDIGALVACVAGDGCAVFCASPLRLKEAASDLLASLRFIGIRATHAETTQPPGGICVIDPRRYAMVDVLLWAALAAERDGVE